MTGHAVSAWAVRTVRTLVFGSLLLVGALAMFGDRATPAAAAGYALSLALRAPSFTHADLAPSSERRFAIEKEKLGSVLLRDRSVLSFTSPGTVVEEHTWARWFRTAQGIENAGNLTFTLDAFVSSAQIVEAYTLLPNGDRLRVDPQHIALRSADGPKVFSNHYQVVVPYSGLEPDAIALLVVKTTYDTARSPLPWGTIRFPQTLDAVESFRVEVRWASPSLKPAWVSNHRGLNEQADGNGVVFSLEPAPAIVTDPSMQSYQDLLGQMWIGIPETWNDLARRLGAIVEEQRSNAPALKAEVDRITAGATTSLDRLERIQRFVSQQIRYVEMDRESSGIIPRPSVVTLKRRFGDCKDKTVLFLDLARLAGFEPYAAITSSQRRDLSGVLAPSIAYFDHMVACVPLVGEERCLDLTIPAIDSNTVPPSLWGAIRLDIKPDTTKPTAFGKPDNGWDGRYEIEREITADGKVQESGKKTYSGAAAAMMRGVLGPLSAVEREGSLRREFRSTNGMELDPSLDSTGLDDAAGPVTIQWRLASPDAWRVDLPGEVRWAEVPLAALVGRLISANEHHPYPVTGSHGALRIRYKLPLTYAVDQVGATLDFQSPYGSLTRTYQIAADRRSVLITTDFRVNDALIGVNDIASFNRFLSVAQQESRPWFSVIQP